MTSLTKPRKCPKDFCSQVALQVGMWLGKSTQTETFPITLAWHGLAISRLLVLTSRAFVYHPIDEKIKPFSSGFTPFFTLCLPNHSLCCRQGFTHLLAKLALKLVTTPHLSVGTYPPVEFPISWLVGVNFLHYILLLQPPCLTLKSPGGQ